jgi:hypothetical protein
MKWFMYGVASACFLAALSEAIAHEMTPTYPKLRPSHLDNVYVTEMEMFNKRNDVQFYEIGVFDKDFKSIPFVSKYEVIDLKYLDHVTFDVYIRKQDVSRATYICSTSKLRKDDGAKRNPLSSKICSKIK